MEYWTFCVRYTDYFPNRFTNKYFNHLRSDLFIPFNIKIVKYSWLGGFRGNHYYMTDSNGRIIKFEKNETDFVNMLVNRRENESELYTLGLTEIFETDYYKNMCLLYHIAFFEECIPEPFRELHETVLSAIKESFLRIYTDTIRKIDDLEKKYEYEPHKTILQKMKKLDEEGGIFKVFEVYEKDHSYFYDFALFDFIKSLNGIETMKYMKDIKDNYEQGKKSFICKGIPKNGYCPVFTHDVDLKKIPKFYYEDDPIHKAYVDAQPK